MSKLLRFQQGYQQVAEQKHTDNDEKDIFQHLGCPFYFRRSQPRI